MCIKNKRLYGWRGFLSTVLMVFCFFSANSQTIRFNKRITLNTTSNDAAVSVLPVHGGYLLAGNDADSLNLQDQDIFITFIDSVGNIKWKKQYGNAGFDYYATSSLLKISGQYILLVDVNDKGTNITNSMLFWLNTNGDTLKTKKYYNNYWENGSQLKKTTDGGYIIVGTSYETDTLGEAFLLKSDSLGNTVWKQYYGDNNYDYGYAVDLASDGGYIIGTETQIYNTLNVHAYIISTDSLGNQLWKRGFGSSTNSLVGSVFTSRDSTYLVTGEYKTYMNGVGFYQEHILKYDQSGNLKWDRPYGSTTEGSAISPLHELVDGNFIVEGQEPSANGAVGFLLKINPQGDSLWKHIYRVLYSNSGLNYLLDVKPTTDKGFVAAGYVIPSSQDTGTEDSWIVKTDSLGCDTVGCQGAGIESLHQDGGTLTVYPNPFKESASVQYFLPGHAQKGELKIYEMATGKLIKTIDLSKHEGIAHIDRDRLATGVYGCCIITDGRVGVFRKVVIIK